MALAASALFAGTCGKLDARAVRHSRRGPRRRTLDEAVERRRIAARDDRTHAGRQRQIRDEQHQLAVAMRGRRRPERAQRAEHDQVEQIQLVA
ncbi:hypothetical protein QM277_19405, partial [Acinetobacter baumannii]|uniref:hypothetical protein n=1 Tax=Acinetobacter baumannii TaxID=470 RepID=UPI0024B63FF6